MKKSGKIVLFSLLFGFFTPICLIGYDFYFRYDGMWKVSTFDRYKSVDRYNKTIFLTYDDGPSNEGKIVGDAEIKDASLRSAITEVIPDYNFQITPTENLLTLLKAHTITALFFIEGKSLAASENGTHQIQRMTNEGHVLGNHTYSHKISTQEPLDWVIEDMIKSHHRLTSLTDRPLNIYRPPYGDWNSQLTHALWENNILGGYIFPMMWTDKFHDWHHFDDPQLAEKIRSQVTNFLERSRRKSGRIVLLHDVWIYGVLVTAELVRQAPQYGFTFGKVETLVQSWQENANFCRKSPYLYYLSDRLGQLREIFNLY